MLLERAWSVVLQAAIPALSNRLRCQLWVEPIVPSEGWHFALGRGRSLDIPGRARSLG